VIQGFISTLKNTLSILITYYDYSIYTLTYIVGKMLKIMYPVDIKAV